ncbi:MAG: SOS response-associated peptidase [Gemmatimonadaceae bacterium]
MCGRASLALDEGDLAAYLQSLGVRSSLRRPSRRYNIAPSQDHVVITETADQRDAHLMRWGLVPSWAKDSTIGNHLINARAEGVVSKPSYRSAFAKRRGLVVVDGFYEWRRNASGPKTPIRISRRDGAPFTLAGLWEVWGAGDDRLTTCTIITTGPNEIMAPIHNRMPVVLAGDARDAWLDSTAATKMLQDLLIPDRTEALHTYEVSPLVNSPRNDNAECWAPVN